MANLINMWKAGDDLRFSISITDSRRNFIPSTGPQSIDISVQAIDDAGAYGSFWDFTLGGFTLGPAEPALENCPEVLIDGVTNTGKYETALTGFFTYDIPLVSVHVVGTGKDKSNFYYVDFIDDSAIISSIYDEVVAIKSALQRQGFRKEKVPNADLMKAIDRVLTETRDINRATRARQKLGEFEHGPSSY